MAERDPSLGGFDRDSGQVKLIPVPSLLRSLLSEHLDPGYAAAAEQRAGGAARRSRWATYGWQALAALLIAVVFAAAMAQARLTAPGVRETQQTLLSGVRDAQADAAARAEERDGLRSEVIELRRGQLAGDAAGQRLLRALDAVSLPAATTEVTGPGVTVTLTDPGVSRNLTDVSKERIPGSRRVVLDRDLQLVVNSLWAGGAEAIAVGGVRIGPNVTIRQAGGAILVDNVPISSPYVVTAIGPPRTLRDFFDASRGLRRVRLLEAAYGVSVTVSTDDELRIPVGNTRNVAFASRAGTP